MSDDASAKQRRFLLLVVGVVVLIGLVGGTIALLSGGGDDSSADPGRSSTPGSEVPTAETLCNAAHVTTYQVAAGGKVRAEATSDAAAKPWGTALTTSTTTNDGITTALVAIGKPGKPAHEVLTITKGQQGWLVTANSACLDLLGPSADCAASSLVIAGTRLAVDTSASLDAGAFKAQGALSYCANVDGKTYVDRGTLAPVTAFTAPGKPTSAIAVGDGIPELYSPAR